MAQRPQVPKFGNWEGEQKVPYTVYFDQARKGRTGGKMINPNDPTQNPEFLSNYAVATGQLTSHGPQAPSPARNMKASDENCHATPGGTEPRDQDSPNKVAAVPKFGDWDEANPALADGYTHIFNKVREEKRVRGTKAVSLPVYSSRADVHRKLTPSSGSSMCCFPWGRK